MLAQLCALRTHDVRALFSLERLSSAALFQETMVCSLGNQRILPKCGPPICTRISAECSTPASGTTRVPAAQTQGYTHTLMRGASGHHISLELAHPLCCDTHCVCFSDFFSFLFSFFIRRRVSVMKGSVLIQDEEILCWPPEDYKTMLLLMS